MTMNQTTITRRSARLEKVEQAESVRLLQLLGAEVYVLGTRRPRGRACPGCGMFLAEHQGTCQTPGLPDLLVFLPGHQGGLRPVLFVEQKAVGGRLRPEQLAFRGLVENSIAAYISGPAAEVLEWLTERGYLLARNAR